MENNTVNLVSGYIMIFIIIAFWIFNLYIMAKNWKKYKNVKKPKKDNELKQAIYYREIPNNENTAAGVAFLTKKLTNLTYRDGTNTLNKVIQATLLELALKGYIDIGKTANGETILRMLEKDTNNLKKSQIIILEFIKRFVKVNDEITISELKKAIRENKNLYRDTFKQEFLYEVISEQEQLGNCTTDIKEYKKSYHDLISTFITIGITGFIAMLFLIITIGKISVKKQTNIPIEKIEIIYLGIGSILTIITIFAIILACKIIKQLITNRKIVYKDDKYYNYNQHSVINNEKKIVFYQDVIAFLTEKGKEEGQNWLLFKKYLEDYTLIKDYQVQSLEINQEYLVYATLFGVANEAQDKLGKYGSIVMYWDEL